MDVTEILKWHRFFCQVEQILNHELVYIKYMHASESTHNTCCNCILGSNRNNNNKKMSSPQNLRVSSTWSAAMGFGCSFYQIWGLPEMKFMLLQVAALSNIAAYILISI